MKEEYRMSSGNLRFPLNFVVPDGQLWPELQAGRYQDIDAALLARSGVGSLNGWVIRTYFHLLQRGEPVSISSVPDKNRINVVSPRDFGRRQRGIAPFILVPRADGHRPMLANFWLAQNQVGRPDRTHDSIPYWPQAGIRARSAARGDRLDQISFKGRLLNLDQAFQTPAFRGSLQRLGIFFKVDAFSGLLGPNSWENYTTTDAVLAVRNLTVYDANSKPASKLINAWFGEAAAILGPEPAFRALRKSRYDYLEVKTPQEALDALQHLKENPQIFRAMIENGRVRRQEFTEQATADRWIDLLNRRVGPCFERWQKTGHAAKLAFCGSAFLLEPISKAWYQHAIKHGRRLLEAGHS